MSLWHRLKETFTTRDFRKPFFHFNPTDEKASVFAEILKKDLGEYAPEDADIIVNIGGDGTIIRALHLLPNIPSFAVRPPESNSTLFNGHHKIESGIDLKAAFDKARLNLVSPLKGEISFSDGSKMDINAYQDIVVRSFNAQAVLSQAGLVDEEPQRIMGCGWIFATAMGSTAINETMGGKQLSFSSQKFVATINGVSSIDERARLKKAGLMSRILRPQDTFDLSLSSKDNKRLCSIDFDSETILPDGTRAANDKYMGIDPTKKVITNLTVSIDITPTAQRQILMNKNFSTQRP